MLLMARLAELKGLFKIHQKNVPRRLERPWDCNVQGEELFH